MPTCGYLCPKCEGRTYLEDGSNCDWCSTVTNEKSSENISDDEWIKSTHQGNCCSDFTKTDG